MHKNYKNEISRKIKKKRENKRKQEIYLKNGHLLTLVNILLVWYSSGINKCICGVNRKMPGRDKLYIVSKEALSEVLKKTLYAKELLETKKVSNITEAIKKAGISRGAFYKYKDLIMPFYDMQSEKKITFLMVLEDVKGVLSKILNIMAKYNVNVITINQNVPIDKVANVTITVDTFETKIKAEDLLKKIGSVDGVKKIDIISSGT